MVVKKTQLYPEDSELLAKIAHERGLAQATLIRMYVRLGLKADKELLLKEKHGEENSREIDGERTVH